ncbi:MAG: porin [Rikenellaceae bacterium]|nr:porin [Rikenellaceae bacterium]
MKKFLLIAAVAIVSICGAQAQEAEVTYNQYGQKVTSLPIKAQVQDGILVFQNKDAGYKMWFDVRVQGDAAVYFGYDKNLTQIGNGMSFRRTRFAVKTQINKDWYAELDTDWSSGIVELKDAILQYDGIENLQIKMGNFKENFSIQRNSTSRYLLFMERAMVTYLAPSRHMGVNFRYSTPALWASFGVFGPEIKGAEEQTAMEDGNKDYGLDAGLSYTGKLVWRPLHKMDNGSLHIGAAVSYREPKVTSTDGYNAIRYSTRNSTSINRKKFLDTDAIPYLDHELLWTVELAGHYESLRYEAAYISRQAFIDVEKNPQGQDLRPASGWYVQAGYMLFGGKQNYDAGGAKYTRCTRGKDWGDVELAARIDQINLNLNRYYMGGSALQYALGINYYPIENVKFMINYQFADNDIFANGKGAQDGTDKTAKGPYRTGYDADGNVTYFPANVDKTKGANGVDFHMISCRFQVAF